jgi:hypothetical protein
MNIDEISAITRTKQLLEYRQKTEAIFVGVHFVYNACDDAGASRQWWHSIVKDKMHMNSIGNNGICDKEHNIAGY